jgi:hypothetical protein
MSLLINMIKMDPLSIVFKLKEFRAGVEYMEECIK